MLEAVTTIPQGGTGDVKYHHGSRGDYQLPDGRSVGVELESNPSHLEHVVPVVVGATRAAQTTARRPARPPGHRRGGADRDPRRRLVPGAGRRRGDAQPAGARRLPGRRVDPHHHEQPGRLHDRPRRRPLDALGVGSREGLRRADHPRQRRRRPRVHERGAARVRLPPAVRPRRAHRPHRLRRLRPQRVRRARVHAAGDVREDQGAQARVGTVGRPARRERLRHARGSRQPRPGSVGPPHARAPAAEGADRRRRRARRLRPLHRRVPARPHAQPRRRHRRPAGGAAQARRGAAARPGGLHGPPEAGQGCSSAAARRSPRRRPKAGTRRQSARIDWAHAEALAFASLLAEGTPIRLTGQDTERGTFSQRHLVLHDAKTGQTICPIQSLPDAQAPFELHNSPLSELACLGLRVRLQRADDRGREGLRSPRRARPLGGAVRRLRQRRAR